MNMEATTTPVTPRYLDVAETAKLVRKALKAAFPGVKFSVRSSRFSMGTAIDVSYTDDLEWREVENVIGVFQGGRFDGMTDSSYGVYSWLCAHGATVAESYGHTPGLDELAAPCCADAELVKFGAKYVHAQRNTWSGK